MLSVALLALVLQAAPPAKAAAPQKAAPFPSVATLKTHCLVFAADPRNPWALAHGITALGQGFKASDGRPAMDVIFKDFLLRNERYDGGVQEGSPYGFLSYARDRSPIEPHPNLHVKTLVMAGVPLSRKLPTAWGELTLGQLVDSVKLGFRHVPQSDDYWESVGWTLDILTATTPPGGTIATSAGPVKIDTVMNDALAYLERANAELMAGYDKGEKMVRKKKQGIYAHACGGLHLVQPVLAWARHPQVRKAWGARWEKQVDLLFYRLFSERPQYDEALQIAPEHQLKILVQMVKFYGHWLETVGRLRQDTTFKPDQNQQVQVNVARAMLDWSVGQLRDNKVYLENDKLRTDPSTYQVYLDLIGDSCHAYHGMAMWQ